MCARTVLILTATLAALQAVSVINTLIIQKVRTVCGHVLLTDASVLHFLVQKQTKQEFMLFISEQ